MRRVALWPVISARAFTEKEKPCTTWVIFTDQKDAIPRSCSRLHGGAQLPLLVSASRSRGATRLSRLFPTERSNVSRIGEC
jgi:hypothetical protein